MASSGKSRVIKELDQLREKGLTTTQSGKLNKIPSSTFLTPEETQAFFKTSTNERRARIHSHIKSPNNLSKASMDDWYTQQKKLYLEEKKKRVEAENFLRGYRQSYCTDEHSVGSETTVTTISTHDTSTKEITGGSEHSPDSMVDSNKVGRLETNISSSCNETGPITAGDHMDEGLRVKESGRTTVRIKTDEKNLPCVSEIDSKESSSSKEMIDDGSKMNLPIEKDEKDSSANLPCVSETDLTETSSNKEIIDDDTTDNIDEMEGTTGPQICDAESGDANNNDNVTVESQQVALTLLTEEDTKDEIRQATQENAQEEEIEQLQPNNPPQDTADVPCSVDLEHCSRDDLGGSFQAEAGRYHLYVSHACPFAHRTAIMLALKGLQETIGVTHLHPTWQFTRPGTDEHRGWVFGSPDGKPLCNTNGYGSFPSSWGQEDPHNHLSSIRELYEMDNDERRQYTVPVMWDIKLKTIVSNNSTDIMRIINSEFNEFALNPELDLYPAGLRDIIEDVNSWVYTSLNDGVYNCGLAESQEAYETAIDNVTEAFDKVESILKEHSYIAGDKITEADVRLFGTLLQFDEIYSVYFKANTRSVSLCPTILKYVRKIYQIDGVKETCDMEMIKAHYYTSHVELNKYSIIPRGEDFMELLQSSRSSR